MKNQLLTLVAASAQDLKTKIDNLSIKRLNKFPHVALAIQGKDICACSFHLAVGSPQKIQLALMAEAVELLSLPTDDIVLDYQIFQSNQSGTNGYFLFMSKTILQSYLTVLERACLLPFKVTTSFLLNLDSFLQQQDVDGQRSCILDFSQQNCICLAVFDRKKCELIREVPYENIQEAKKEIIQSLRSVTNSTQASPYRYIYYSGHFPHKEKFIGDIKEVFQIEKEQEYFLNNAVVFSPDSSYFSLNILRSNFLSFKQYKTVKLCLHAALILMFLFGMKGFIQIINNHKDINEIKRSFSQKDYRYAKDLERQIKRL